MLAWREFRSSPSFVMTLIFGVCLFSVIHELFLPFLPVVGELFASRSAGNTSIGAFMSGVGFGTLFAGSLADRFGRKPIFVCALFLSAVGPCAYLLDPSMMGLLITRTIVGLGVGSALVISRVAAREALPVNQIMKVSSWLSLSVGLATILAPLVGASILSSYGLNGYLIFTSLLCLGALVFCCFAFEETLGFFDGKRLSRPVFVDVGWKKILSGPHFQLLTLCICLGWGVMVVLGASLPVVLSKVYGLKLFAYSSAISAAYLSYFLGVLYGRRLLSNRSSQEVLHKTSKQILTLTSLGVASAFGGALSSVEMLLLLTMAIYFRLGALMPLIQILVLRENSSAYGATTSLFYFFELGFGALLILLLPKSVLELPSSLFCCVFVLAIGLVIAAWRFSRLGEMSPMRASTLS
jgi:MFS transporter, DHA1 family, multidrug resistance protein